MYPKYNNPLTINDHTGGNTMTPSSTESQNSTLRHIVIIRFSSRTSEEQIRKVTQDFKALKEKIPGITSFEHGVNNSPENEGPGITHIYLMTFESVEARDTYLPHPEHQKFSDSLEKYDIEEVLVFDYHPVE